VFSVLVFFLFFFFSAGGSTDWRITNAAVAISSRSISSSNVAVVMQFRNSVVVVGRYEAANDSLSVS
jgi:hypothetical protein